MRMIFPSATDWHGGGAGGIATLTLPNAPYRVHGIDVLVSEDGTRATQAQIIASIDYVEFQISGTEQRRIYPGRLFKTEKVRASTFRPGRVPIRFSQPERRSMYGEDKTSLVLNQVGTVTLKVKFKSDATATTLDHRLIASPTGAETGPEAGAQGPLITYIEKQVPVTAAGLKKATYKSELGRAVSMIHAFTDQITAMRVLLGNTVVWDFLDKQALDDQLIDAGYVPQDDVWSFGGELMTSRFTDSMLTGNSELRFEFTMAGAGDFFMQIEELGAPKA